MISGVSPGPSLCLCPYGLLSLQASASVPFGGHYLLLCLYLAGAPAVWYLNADDNGPAHRQQLVVHGEEPVEDWQVAGEKRGAG